VTSRGNGVLRKAGAPNAMLDGRYYGYGFNAQWLTICRDQFTLVTLILPLVALGGRCRSR